MGYHPLLDECLKGAQRVIKAQSDIKFDKMMQRKYPRDVPKVFVKASEELLKYELLALSIMLDKWVGQGAPFEGEDHE